VRELKRKLELRIWMDVGTGEEQEYISTARSFRDALVNDGWVLHRDLEYSEVEGAKHDPEGWARRVGPMLRFLFPKAGGGATKIILPARNNGPA
jgi:hypothetical protein